MNPYIIIAILFVVLIVDHAQFIAGEKKLLEYVSNVSELAEQIVEQHERYKALAETMSRWYHIAQQSNEEVDRHYDLVNEQYENVMTVMNLMMKNKEENKNGMAV